MDSRIDRHVMSTTPPDHLTDHRHIRALRLSRCWRGRDAAMWRRCWLWPTSRRTPTTVLRVVAN